MCFDLHTLQDDAVEGDHSLLLSLVSVTAGTMIGPIAQSIVTIVDDGTVLGLHLVCGAIMPLNVHRCFQIM